MTRKERFEKAKLSLVIPSIGDHIEYRFGARDSNWPKKYTGEVVNVRNWFPTGSTILTVLNDDHGSAHQIWIDWVIRIL